MMLCCCEGSSASSLRSSSTSSETWWSEQRLQQARRTTEASVCGRYTGGNISVISQQYNIYIILSCSLQSVRQSCSETQYFHLRSLQEETARHFRKETGWGGRKGATIEPRLPRQRLRLQRTYDHLFVSTLSFCLHRWSCLCCVFYVDSSGWRRCTGVHYIEICFSGVDKIIKTPLKSCKPVQDHLNSKHIFRLLPL